MIRVVAIYSGEIDPGRYEQHAALCRKVASGTFRHGPVTRTLFGEPLHHYAEWEFADTETFREASASDGFKAAGADAAAMGVPHSVYVIEVA
jgi:hypothetical protein